MLKIKDGFNLGIGLILANAATVIVAEALKVVIGKKEEPKPEKTEETN